MPGKTKGGAADAPPPAASSLDQGADWRATWGAGAYDGEAAVAAAILDADVDDRLADLGADDPRPGHALEGIKPGEWKPDETGLPPGCPVLPLGTEDGTFFFLDGSNVPGHCRRIGSVERMTKAWFRYERQNGRWCPVVHYGDKPKVPNGEEDRFSASYAVAEGHLGSDGSPMFGRLQAAFPAPGEGT